MRQSLFQVISRLRNLGDLPGKHPRGGKNIIKAKPPCHLELNSFGLSADSHSRQSSFSPSVAASRGLTVGTKGREVPQEPWWEGCEGNGISGIVRMGRKKSLLASSPCYMCSPCLCVLLYILLSGFPYATCLSLRAPGRVFNVVHRWCSQKSRYLLMGFCAKRFHCSFQKSACLCQYAQTPILPRPPLPCS